MGFNVVEDRACSRLSHFRGDQSQALIEMTIGAAFDDVANRYGDRIALVVRHQRIRWTYRDLARHVDDFAMGLWQAGLRPGDRIGIWAPNCVEWTVTQYAAAKIGLILVNLNPAYRLTEIKYALTKVGCKALVFAHSFKESRYLDMLRELAPEIARDPAGRLQASAMPELRLLICTASEHHEGVLRFADIANEGSRLIQRGLDAWPDGLKPHDPINIQFTSGTTGAPKAATLSHRGLLNNAWFTGEVCGTSHDDAICVPLPLFHIFGMLTGNLLAMLRGAKIVHPGDAFDADSVLSAVEEERCTSLYGVPTMFVSELASLSSRRRDLSSLRTGIIAGAVVPMELLRRVMTEMHMTGVVNGYGMTETSSAIMVTSPTDTPARRVTSVGRVVPHVEAKIVDGNGATVAIGQPGEIYARGYSTMLGYWNDPGTTATTIDQEGWLRTGDIGVFDEHGYGKIVGRIKEMVIRGGENISCGEIEEFLQLHPAVESVYVVGVPDDKYGEELCACVQLKQGKGADSEEIRAFCRGKIAHFKIPRYVRFVDDFPLTASGKVQKFALARSSGQALGLLEPDNA
jgi:fatty-acyl-CoA synthase